MQLKSLRNLLMVTTGVGGAIAAGLVIWGCWPPSLELPELTLPAQPALPAKASSPTPSARLTPEELASLRLQGPKPTAVEVPEIAEGPPLPSASSFPIQLLGTMIEQGYAVGLFRDAAGIFDVKGEGQTLELTPSGIKIEQVEPGVVLVAYSGQSIRLELPTTESKTRAAKVAFPTVQPPSPSSSLPRGASSEASLYQYMVPAGPEAGTSGDAEDIFAPLPDILNPLLPPPQPDMPGMVPPSETAGPNAPSSSARVPP
jgi:hypothetical protein